MANRNRLILRAITMLTMFFALSVQKTEGQSVISRPSQSVGAADILSVGLTDGIHPLNPSVMAEAEGFNATASYAMPYGIADLQQITGKAVYATPYCNIDAAVSKNGSSESSYTEFGGGVSRMFHNWGVGMEYHAIIHKLPNNQSYTSSYSRIGVHANPTSRWTVSLFAHNIERRKIEYEYTSVNLEPMAALGLRWKATNMFNFACEVEKGWDHDAVGKVAVCVIPHPSLNATFGFSTLGSSVSAGVGYTYRNITLHTAISHHDQLGITSAGSISVSNIWGNKK